MNLDGCLDFSAMFNSEVLFFINATLCEMSLNSFVHVTSKFCSCQVESFAPQLPEVLVFGNEVITKFCSTFRSLPLRCLAAFQCEEFLVTMQNILLYE